MQPYIPREDSYLLSEILEEYLNPIKNKSISILDMGSGSGIQAETCRKLGFNNILTADINQEAIKHLKKQGFKSIKSNLFSNIDKKEKFDLIIFNPPYLPENKLEPKYSKLETTGGKQGYEIIIKFLNQARLFLNSKGSVLLLFSSLSQPSIIKKQANLLSFKIKLLNKKKLFFEELYVHELKL